MKAKRKQYMALFVKESEGGFSVSVPELPGCFSQGDTYEEAVNNIQEAIDLYLEDINPNDSLLYQTDRAQEQFLCRV